MPTEFVEDPDATVAEGGIVSEGTSSDYARVWETLIAACETQENVRSLVVDAGRGGLTVDLGVRGEFDTTLAPPPADRAPPR